ncbi:MAG: AMP-binding protein, partial [Acidimicrobiales bacterium]|nr:AMP-binding protein [Acidimicrobiales bacterium]
MSYNLSELFERVAGAVPDREAVVTAQRRLTFRELDERADRLAAHLSGMGVSEGDRVGLQLQNGTEYLEGMLALFKLRTVPVNINYRYVERELQQLFADAGLVALIVHEAFAPRVEAIRHEVPTLRHVLVCADDASPASDYETALAAAEPGQTHTGRSSDDIYCAYTGGTTGL